jgi:hypothetical protein
MPLDHRQAVFAIPARLDQLTADAESIVAQPVYADVGARAEELRELIVEMQALVEENIDQQTA